MYLEDYSRAGDLVEKNRQILNQKLHQEIRKTGNLLFGLFYDMLKNGKISQTQKFLEKLKSENAKASRIKRWQFHYQHLNSNQQSILKILKQLFDQKFPEIASDPQIGGLYFNQDLKDLVRFDFIFGYEPHNPLTSDDVQNYTAKFFLNGGYKQSDKKELDEKDKKEKKHKTFLAKGHRLLNEQNYQEYKDILHKTAENCIKNYSNKFGINVGDKIGLKSLLEKYFVYILRDTLLQSNLVLEGKTSKDSSNLKIFIIDTLQYLENIIGEKLNIEESIIVKKFFRNTDSDNILPIEFSYNNTLEEDIIKWEKYFNETYFNMNNVSCRGIYSNIMIEFGSQSDLIKATHAIYSPQYFIDKDKKEKLDSEISVLTNCEPKDISLQNLIDSKKEELIDIMTKLDKHFYSKIDKEKLKGSGLSMEEITQKYMKYYKIPPQYRRNFFILVNYLNHYHKMKSDLFSKAQEYNKKLENLVLNSPNSNAMIMYFMKEYITISFVKEKFNQKWTKSLESKFQLLKSKIFNNNLNKNERTDKSQEIQLDLNF